ncbi:MAG: LysR family transcriptional regulator, partial [Clostridia bacterium]
MIDQKLKTLLCVIKEGGYTKAAECLSLSQPAVSYHIKQLEEELSIKIFYRNLKKLTLTPEGEVLVKYAKRLEGLSETAYRALLDTKQHLHHFTVGITPTCGEALVGRMFTGYCNEHPHTKISLVTGTLEQLCDKLTGYELDFAIVEGSVSLKHCRAMLLDLDYLCLVMSPEHRLAKRSAVTLEELKAESLILRRGEAGTRRLFESSLAGQRENIRNFDVRLEMDNINTIKELVASNLGVTVIAHSACREETAAGQLVAVPIEGMKMIREINIICQDDFDHPELLKDIQQL